MKKNPLNLSLFLLCIVAGSASAQESHDWEAPARAAKKKNPVAADAASLARGKEVYAKECDSCHGPRGRGDGRRASELERKPGDLTDTHVKTESDGALFWKLTSGNKPMPSFEETLSEPDRWNVINYLRTFAR